MLEDVSAAPFSGEDSFTQFTSEMVRLMKEEEVRAKHQAGLLRLREKAVKEKTRAEMAWLESQKRRHRDKGADDVMPSIRKRQRGVLMRLQAEQVVETRRNSTYLSPEGARISSLRPFTLMRFCLKRVHFDAFRPSVHTYTPSIFIKKRIDLKTLLKVDQNENAHVSYSSGQSNKKKMMTENITGACVCSMRVEFNLRHNVQFYRFLTF